MIVAPGGPYTDVDVSVRFKPISGREDASGGIVFRFADGRYYETDPLRPVQTVPTERGAHTLAFDPSRNRIYAFLPGRHAAAVYVDDERG